MPERIGYGDEHLRQGGEKQRRNDTALTIYIIYGHSHQQHRYHAVEGYRSNSRQPASTFQYGHLATCYRHQEDYRRQQDKMQRVVAPAESPRIEKRTEQHANDETEYSRQQAPEADQGHMVKHTTLIATVYLRGNILNGTHGYSKVCRLRDQLYRGVEQRHQAHSARAEYYGNELVADNTHQYVEKLDTTKEPSIFHYVRIRVFLVFRFHRCILNG